MNSGFADWYFRLGSTNAAVSHYQLTNIPCPRFGKRAGKTDSAFCKGIDGLLEHKKFSVIEDKCISLAAREACGCTLERVIVSLIKFIEREEKKRGQIARAARSRLAEDAEKCQVVLDKIMLALLGLDARNHEYISTRLSEML